MSCKVNVNQIFTPPNTVIVKRQQDAGDPGSIVTTNIYITNDVLQKVEVVDVCRGTQGPAGPEGPQGETGPPGSDGVQFDVLPIASGGTNNTSFNADYIIYYDGSNDQLASTDYTIQDILNGVQALTGIVEGSGIQTTELGSNQTRIDSIVGYGLDIDPVSNAIYLTGIGQIQPGQLDGILPINKGGTANTVYSDGKLIAYDSSALNGSGQFISATNLDVNDIVVSGDGFTLAAGSGLVNGGFVIIPNGTGRIDIPESADITVFADSFELSQTGTPGTYSKVTTDSKGRVTLGEELSPQDIYNILGYIPWHSGNDGCGSQLDADMLCGQSGDYYLNATNITGIINTGVLPDIMTEGRYTKVDVNTKGLVTSGMQMTPEDIENILGYDPVSPTGGVDFCGDVELHGSLFINKPTGCNATDGFLRVYDNLPMFARNNQDISAQEPRGFSFIYGGGLISRTGSLAYYPTDGEGLVKVTTNMFVNNNGVDGGDSDDEFTDDINGGDANSIFPISNLTGDQRTLLYRETADDLYVSRYIAQIVQGEKNFVDGITVGNQVKISGQTPPSVPPTDVGTNTLLNVNFNADLLDDQHGDYYLDAGNVTGDFDSDKVSFPYINGTPNYIPKFKDDGRPESNSIVNSIMYQSNSNNIVIKTNSSLVVGDQTNNFDVSSNRNNIMAGENHSFNNTSNSLIVGTGHNNPSNNTADSNAYLGRGGNSTENLTVVHGDYGEGWVYGQISHGAFETRDTGNVRIEHGQATDFLMYLEGQQAAGWADLTPSVQLPEDHTIGFKVTLLMNSAFTTGVAEFEFLSGIVKNVTFRDPNNPTETITETVVAQQPKKHEIYNNSYIKTYNYSLLCTDLNELQYEEVKYDTPPIKVNDIVIENLPNTLNLQEEDPDGFYATYTKDNLGALTIDVDPPSFTGSYRINSEGDIVVYCNDHDLTVGTYTYLTFDSFSSIALPDQRYLVKSILSENEFTAEQQFWLAEKQSNNSNFAVFTILPESLQEKDNPMSFDIDVQVFNKSGVQLINLDPATSPTNWCDSKTYEYNKKALRNLTVDSNCLLSDNPVVLREKGGDYDFIFNTGINGPTNTTLKYYDYSWEYFRKSQYVKVSGDGTVVQYSSPNTLTTSLFASTTPPKYSNMGYVYNETYNYENAYAGGLWTALSTLPSGLTIETTTSLPNIPDGSFVNIGAFVENSGAVRVRKRQKQSGTYERISYNANKIIDCVYTRYTNTSGESAVHIYAEEYVDLGLLDRPYSFSLFDNDIGTNDNDKFEIVEDNDLYYLYTAQDMPSVPSNYYIEIKALDHYGTNEFIKKLEVTVSDTISLANDEAGLDNIVLVNGGVVATDTPAGEFITLISGVGGYDPLVVFEQGYNSFSGIFNSGSSIVQCTGVVSKEYETTTLYGDPCGLCTGVSLLVDFEQGPPNQVVQIEEIWCVKDLQATPLLNSSKVIYTYPAISQNSVRVGQKFNIGSVEYTVGSELPQTSYSNKYGFSASTSANAGTERIALNPNIGWINYTGLPSNLFQPPQGITASPEDVFEPRVPESGLLLDSNIEIELEFDEPVTNLVLCFSGVQASNLQGGYILQEDKDEILLEDGLGSLVNDFANAPSGAIISDRPLLLIDKANLLPITDIVPTMVSFTGLDCRFSLCATGTFDKISFTAAVDQGTTYALSIGELVPKTIDTSDNATIRIDTPYTGYNNDENYITVEAEILYTGTPIDSGNLPISGLKKAEMFFDCQNSSSSGVYGYETTPALDYDACYVTGECQVFSAKSTVDENGDVQGQASYLITFDEDIYISTTRDSFIQLTDWTPTDSDPTRTVVPEQGHYPISVVTNITNNSFVIPEEYAISLPIPGTGMSRQGTVSGNFDIYHPYKTLADNIMNQIPAQFLDVQRTYNPAINDAEYKPKDNLFDIMAITGSTIYTEDKLNYLLIEEDRPPYLDQVVSGNYVTDSRDFNASISPYSNRLRDLSFDPDNTRDLNYADAPWSLKDIYVLADYDSANSRLTLYNIPTGIFKPLDTVQISFNSPSSHNNSGCNLFPVYHDVPAEDMYLYTGLPITQPSGENIGNILFTFSEVAPEGWIVLDGSTYDRAQYAALAQYLDFHRVLYSSGWALGDEGWTASTVPDLRKVTPVGHHENTITAFSNIGEIVRDTGNKLLLENNKNGDFGQPDNIVGNWIMYTEGSFIDPRYPINFSDSGTLNYIINNVDIKDLDGNKTDNFISPYARLRIDILQLLEPDIRMNYAGGEDSPNYVYIQNSPTDGNDIVEPCVPHDIDSCDFNGPYSDPYKVYTPTNSMGLKLRYDENAQLDQRYSIVLRDKSDFLNYDEDIGVAHLFTKKIYDFDAGITGNAWWPEGVLPLSGANDGPAKSPLIYTSGGGGIPDNEGTAQDWFVWEYNITPNPSEMIFFDNYAYSGQFGVWIRASGEGYGEDDNIGIRITTIDKYSVESVKSCTLMNDSPYSDGYVISNGNGGFYLYTVDAGDRLKIDWAGAVCDTDVPPAVPSGTGSLTLEVYGGSYQQGNGKPVIVKPPSVNHIRNDFIYDRQRNPRMAPRTVYQIPSVELRYNVCTDSIGDRIRWYTLPYKTSIDTFNVPRSYLEYGDEFKLTSINKNNNFSDTVTRTLTKINPTSETTSISGLATSSDLCRFIPCTTDSTYTKYRKTIMWGDQATDSYPAISNLNYRVTGYFESGDVQHIDFMDIFPLSEDQFTFTVNMYNEDDLPFTGCVLTEEDGSWVSMAEYVGCTSQDQKTVTFEAFPRSVSLKVAMHECSGIVGFSVTSVSPAIGTQDVFPKPWSDPLLTTAAHCPVSYANNTFKSIDTFWQAPFESCNTGLYQDRPRSSTPFGLDLKQDIGWTGICEFTKTISGRMYIPENNNLYFHTYGGTTAHWPLDYKGSGTPTQQTGVYIIDSVPDFGSANTCSSGLMCIEISGYNNLEITGIPTFGDRENIGQSPIVIESNGVTGIVSNYGAIKQLFFDFDDGLPQLSNVYNVIDYTDGRKKIVINAPYDASVVNKSGLVFMIENDENIKTHLNPNVNNEFNVYDPQVAPPEIFDGQINHFDLNTRRWKHLCHYDFDAIGTGTFEITVSLSGTQDKTNIYPIFPTGIELSGIRIAQSLSEGFTDYQNSDSFLINNSTEDFYVQFVTINGTPPYTDNAFVEIPKVSISGIQEYEFELDPLDGLTVYHGSGWTVCAKVNRTEELIDQREITLRAEDITGKADIALSYSTSFLPEVIQSYTGYANFGESQWTLIYDTKFIDLSVLGTNVLEFELLGAPTTGPFSYSIPRDNVLVIQGNTDSSVTSTTYYDVTLIARTGIGSIPMATGTGLLVDIKQNSDSTPLDLTLNNFNNFGPRGKEGTFYLETETTGIIKFDIPQPQGDVVTQGGDPFEITYINQGDISNEMGYLISTVYNTQERRYNVTMTPTGVDNEYYNQTDRFSNQQLKIVIPYRAWSEVDQSPIVPTPSTESFPVFETILYTGLNIANSNPNTVQYYEKDEPWTIQVRVSGGVNQHDPTTRPNLRVFNTPNKGSYANDNNPIDCVLNYRFQNQPGATYWIVDATARRDVLGNYMNQTGQFRLYVNADDGLTDYKTLNDAEGINDQFVIIYNEPSGFVHLPPLLHSVPSAPFFTHCDVLSTNTGFEPTIIVRDNYGINLSSIDYRFDEDFPLWQRAYEGTQGDNFIWDAKVEISNNGLITTSVKGLGDDKIQAVAKFETIEIESDQLDTVPFKIESVAPSEEESEQFPSETGIIIEQGKPWELQVITVGGIADPRYPPTIILNDMPTPCTGFNPLDSELSTDQQCISSEPTFDGLRWTYSFSGQASCDLLGVLPFDILALDTLPGGNPLYPAADTFDANFIYETGKFQVLGPEVVFTGGTELYPQCDICYTGYVDFGPKQEEDLDCNAVTGIKSVSFSGQLPSGLDYEIFFPTSTEGVPVSRGKGTGTPPTVVFPAPWNNLASGYIEITGCPTHFAEGGGSYPEEGVVIACNAVDDCEQTTIIFEDASKPIPPNVDFSYFFLSPDMALTPKTGLGILGKGDANKSYAPAAQEYNLDCGTRLPINECRTYLMRFDGAGQLNGTFISGIYPEGQPNNNKIDLENSPNNFVYVSGDYGGGALGPERYVAISKDDFNSTDTPGFENFPDYDLFVSEGLANGTTGLGLVVVEKVPNKPPTVDKLNLYFEDMPFDHGTNLCILGGGDITAGTVQGEQAKYGLTGQIIPKWSGQFVDDNSTFADDDEYMSGLNLVEINTDTDVPVLNTLTVNDCYSTGYMRISGIVLPPINSEITDPPPVATAPFWTFRNLSLSLATRLSYGDTEVQRANPPNNRIDNLYWNAYDAITNEKIENGTVSSNGAFSFITQKASGVVYVISIENKADFAPSESYDTKGYSKNDYPWIHKGDIQKTAPTQTTFPPILPTGFEYLDVRFNTSTTVDGYALGGYVIPDPNSKVLYQQNGVSAYPYWQDLSNNDYSSSQYLPSISGMVLTSIPLPEPLVATANVDTGNDTPLTGIIPVPDDYVGVGDRVDIMIAQSTQVWQEGSYVLTADNLTGTPVTGVVITTNNSYFGTSSPSGVITKKMEVVSINTTGVVVYHPDIDYTVGDIVTLETPSGTSSRYTACNDLNLIITDGDSSSMELSISTTDQSWYDGIVSVGDAVTINKQEEGELRISNVSSPDEGQYLYDVVGTPTTLYKDYIFRIVTCENATQPFYTAGLSTSPKLYHKDYNLYVSKPISIVQSSISMSGTKTAWVLRFNIDGGLRPVQNNSPRVMLKYGTNLNGTFCGFTRTVVDGPPTSSVDPLQENRMIDEYDEVNDQLIIELRGNSDYDWNSQSTITLVVSDETGSNEIPISLPSSN